MKINFSVLIPVYFREQPTYLQLALESVINQTLPASEIVLVKDGPLTKELDDMILHFQLAYPHLFKIVALPTNMGMGYAMNVGLKQCSCDWVARMDSDDICRLDRFEKQIAFLLNNPQVQVLGGSIEEFRQAPGDLKQIRKLPLTNTEIIAFSKTRNPMNHMTVMFKKENALQAGGYWPKRVLEDYNLWVNMILHESTLANLNDVLVDARIGNNMVGRRSGFNYLKMEINFFLSLYRKNYINLAQFFRAITSRTIMKFLPIKLLENLYRLFLRNKI